jgi:3-hydroxy-9,10-secoandrosta-1,3,5(10)-triene-9,17-dione monooxygenase reductase component
MAVSSDTFRRAMGLFATGVGIITARKRDGAPWGFTANAFTSVSLEPPLVLFCVGSGRDSFTIVSEAEHFAVNFLSEEQEELSRRFASRMPDRFEGVVHAEGTTGTPLLEGTLGFVECRKVAEYAAGDHTIVVGEVVHAAVRDGNPLVFFRSAYRHLDA